MYGLLPTIVLTYGHVVNIYIYSIFFTYLSKTLTQKEEIMIKTITPAIYTEKTSILGGTRSFRNTALERFPRTAIGKFRGNVLTARSNYIENSGFSQNAQLPGANRHLPAPLCGWRMK